MDGALAAGLAVFGTMGTVFASHGQPGRRPFDVWAFALILMACGALVALRRHPVAVLEVVFAVNVAYFAAGYANRPIWLPLVVVFVTAVLRGHPLAAAGQRSPSAPTGSGSSRIANARSSDWWPKAFRTRRSRRASS